jgi:IMP dehydrogenase
VQIGRNREARRAYGFDDIALAPGVVTVDPEDTDVRLTISDLTLETPVLAAAMDGAVNVPVMAELSQLGGLGVMNGEGLQTRYEHPEEAIARIIEAPTEGVVPLIQRVYTPPIQPSLLAQRIHEAKAIGAKVAISLTPARALRLAPAALEAGVDVLVIQSTVTTVRHRSRRYEPFPLAEFCRSSPVPVIVGNCVTYEAAFELMEAQVSAVLVGVGPGHHCTTRRVLGLGVPQATAIADVAAARDDYLSQTGRRVAVIADGGMRTGGDVAKAIACGADGVMLGTSLAAATESPGQGFIWGMATPDPGLPRGTRIKVGHLGTLREILLGPATKDDGTLNLIGALRTAMGACGADTIQDMQKAEIVIAPAIQTEAKRLQVEQKVGMGK